MRRLVGWVYLLPSLVVFAAFFFYPLYRLVFLGLHQQNRTGTAGRWRGWDNIADTLGGDVFVDGLVVSATYVLFTVPLGVALGVALAVSAHRRLRGIRFFQTVFASTVATSVAVASVVFFVLLDDTTGYLRDVGFLALDDPDTALRGVALSSVWQNLGLTFVIVLAGLQAIPTEVDEAALLDGYTPWARFWRITVPLLGPTLVFLAVVLVVFAFQAYAQADLLTDGGPNGATETLVFRIFERQQPVDQDEGAAVALGLFGVTFVVSLVQFSLLDRRTHHG